MRIDGFDWDAGNWPKCGKHGVTRAEIEAVFVGGADVFPDLIHSAVERRFLAIGRTPAERHVLVTFTLRTRDGQRLIRPVSARFMHAKEVSHHERRQEASDPDQR